MSKPLIQSTGRRKEAVARVRLRAHRFDRLRRRPDEDDVRLGAGTGELGVLGEEAVARVHRVGTGGSSGEQYLQGAVNKNYIYKELAGIITFLIERRNLPQLPDRLHQALRFSAR